jgi:hypothetical protein
MCWSIGGLRLFLFRIVLTVRATVLFLLSPWSSDSFVLIANLYQRAPEKGMAF